MLLTWVVRTSLCKVHDVRLVKYVSLCQLVECCQLVVLVYGYVHLGPPTQRLTIFNKGVDLNHFVG